MALDWSDGYVTEIDYNFGYYGELNPLRADLALATMGFVPPGPGDGCELGFGQGLSINIHAASGAVSWWGNDFNPVQAGFAREMAAASGARSELSDEAFFDFCARDDLPDFSFIGLHGIWSWISDTNRKTITDFIRRKLKVGGVLYVSYNVDTGWAPSIPLRNLLVNHSAVMSAPGSPIVSRIDEALKFAEDLEKVNPAFFRANTPALARLNSMKGLQRNYLAHEYFNKDWRPMSFSEMDSWMSDAKMSYACSANYLELVPGIGLTPDQQSFISGFQDVVFRETVRDFVLNQQFRRDYWIKGGRKITNLERHNYLLVQRVLLIKDCDSVALNVKGPQGEAVLAENIYRPVLSAMAEKQPISIYSLAHVLREEGVNIDQLIECLLVLIGKGDVVPVREKNLAANAKKHTDRLNAYFFERARSGAEIAYLASPLTGGGINVGRFQQLFLLAISKGRKSPDDWAGFAWEILSSQNQIIMKDGVALRSAEDNICELRRQAKEFLERDICLLKTLQIA
ncbi:methyltransferase regulatory domain-containing protein [uncultured Xylophilus sp.]|uniref:methyltransferase regulatory domain-containing protein n=1 Tax=uncultured Xylophilus sp. TaxID=296832 RepID=UPI0025F90AA8|nr:methyltransferase regulatory domain-containing protein [uncultured Xylophilus sp.]